MQYQSKLEMQHQQATIDAYMILDDRLTGNIVLRDLNDKQHCNIISW